MNRKYSFKKNHEIDKLVKLKQSVGNKYYAIYFMRNKETTPQIAITASKRFKNAVERNYEKRVVKEILRNHLNKIENFKLLIVIKTTVQELNMVQKKDQVLYLLKKLTKEEK
jgi:ribonuclease P protein component